MKIKQYKTVFYVEDLETKEVVFEKSQIIFGGVDYSSKFDENHKEEEKDCVKRFIVASFTIMGKDVATKIIEISEKD